MQFTTGMQHVRCATIRSPKNIYLLDKTVNVVVKLPQPNDRLEDIYEALLDEVEDTTEFKPLLDENKVSGDDTVVTIKGGDDNKRITIMALINFYDDLPSLTTNARTINEIEELSMKHRKQWYLEIAAVYDRVDGAVGTGGAIYQLNKESIRSFLRS